MIESQQERTVLAWRRSSLSLCVAALVIGRLAIEDSVPALVVVVVAGAVVALWTGLTSLRRDRWRSSSRTEPEFDNQLRDGRLPFGLAAVAGSLCLIELAVSVVQV